MVVVGMRPARSVHLTGRDTYGAESSYQEGRFFTAASVSRLDSSHRGTCTDVGRGIDYFFMTPVVYFQHGIVHG